MGLDVYLKKYEDFKKTVTLEEEASKYSEAQYAATGKKYDDLTKEEKDEISERINKWNEDHGLSKWGSDEAVESIELSSAIDPTHLFKVGYFRSSYNDGGINNVLREQLGRDLYDIFQKRDNEEYRFQPDWAKAKEFTEAILAEWRVKLANEPSVTVDSCRYNEFDGPPDNCTMDSEAKALEAFETEYNGFKDRALKKSHNNVLNYGPFEVVLATSKRVNPFNSVIADESEARLAFIDLWKGQNFDEDNELFQVPLKVRGIIGGVRSCTDGERAVIGINKIPCCYLVVDKGDAPSLIIDENDWSLCGSYSNRAGRFAFGKPIKVVGIIHGLNRRFFVDESLPCQYLVSECDHKFEWYQKALEIVIETCNWVLAQPEQEKYYLHWSA